LPKVKKTNTKIYKPKKKEPNDPIHNFQDIRAPNSYNSFQNLKGLDDVSSNTTNPAKLNIEMTNLGFSPSKTSIALKAEDYGLSEDQMDQFKSFMEQVT
jgi:hypothetical protein